MRSNWDVAFERSLARPFLLHVIVAPPSVDRFNEGRTCALR